MKYIPMIFALLFLASCQTTNPSPTITKYVAIDIPDILYQCPQIAQSDLPDPETVTNRELSLFISKLYQYHKICGISIENIKKFEIQAKEIVAKRNT